MTLTVVGHEEGGRYFQHLPPLPPRIHTFLYACSGAEVRGFMERSDWTALVLASALPTADDVLAAALREAAPHFDDSRAFLVGGVQDDSVPTAHGRRAACGHHAEASH